MHAHSRVAEGKLSYGQTLKVPIAGKDCIVIEVGLDAPDKPAPYADYEKAVASIERSFDTLFRVSVDDIVDAARRGPVRMEVGQTAQDRRLAAEVIETLGAAIGRWMSMDDLVRTPPQRRPTGNAQPWPGRDQDWIAEIGLPTGSVTVWAGLRQGRFRTRSASDGPLTDPHKSVKGGPDRGAVARPKAHSLAVATACPPWRATRIGVLKEPPEVSRTPHDDPAAEFGPILPI